MSAEYTFRLSRLWWLGRSPSNAFQERVFTTGGFVMSSLRARTDNQRAEVQVLLKHNRAEIRRTERESGGAVDQGVDHRNY
ncbi:hypothetical protein PR003_g31588 [Phytophthora rubi]|uniref:HAT C-terminal dimerisation domain-containing protein n=1 Tax=Phytophthora rubi TaxID=129364 RepID=A0A6A4B2L9_9STRA|nr:hypothetical protein PR002_g30440 [Phytophthora rubi]KAE9268016.1 hypothetical protein PR003_g31588 [Phytophthora rubi]